MIKANIGENIRCTLELKGNSKELLAELARLNEEVLKVVAAHEDRKPSEQIIIFGQMLCLLGSSIEKKAEKE